MMVETTHWHHMAYLYSTNALQLPEIVKLYVINTAIGLIEGEKEDIKIGINVFDNSQLYKAMVYGVILALPDDKPVAYNMIGDMLLLHRNTVGRAVKQLVEEGVVSKEDHRPVGSAYTVEKDLTVPYWIIQITDALVQINVDNSIYQAAQEYCMDISFQRGWDVFKSELRDKFFPSRDKN